MGKKSNAKRSGGRGGGVTKLLPHTRSQLSALVDDIFKKCTKVPPVAAASTPAQEWAEYMEVYQLIEKVRELEKDIQLPTYPRMEQVGPFMSWMKEKNIMVTGVEIWDFGAHGLGLRVKEDLKQGQEVLAVPLEAMLTEDTAKKSYLGPLMERDPILQKMGNVCLALHVLGERVNSQSPWEPYLRILPHSYTTILYSTPQQLQGLQSSPVLEEAVKLFRIIARQYSYFYRILHSLPEAKSWPIKDYFTFDAYRWAVSTVMTRQNRIPMCGSDGVKGDDDNVEVGQMALIPGWDMTNHQQGTFSTDYDSKRGSSVCLAQRDFHSGEEFTIHYTNRPNSDLFLHNGFVYPENENDSLGVKLGVSKKDALYQEKVELLTCLGLPSSGTFLLVPGPHPISPQLLAFTRIFCMDKDSLEKWRGDGVRAKGLMHEDCDVGTSTQDKTWAFLHTRVALLTRAYPTSLEDDVAAVTSASDFPALVQSLLICEKKILRDATTYLSARIAK
ncbi:hypothetical protein Pmani_019577 [Petrolisthes manimaculis]|uniref:protein-histidine N-methyltransferase n=1 Tax=Petrolisthes manimaculis TaxID=1843537 RepID=A0AAE1U3E8_9EUCA|nr:hypothetical protein Pmani_019577 [Petrolisthes manimaculis]